MLDVTASYGTPLDFIAFFGYFQILTTIHVWTILSSTNFHRLCVGLMHIFLYVNLPNVTVGYERFSDSSYEKHIIHFMGLPLGLFAYSFFLFTFFDKLIVKYVPNELPYKSKLRIKFFIGIISLYIGSNN